MLGLAFVNVGWKGFGAWARIMLCDPSSRWRNIYGKNIVSGTRTPVRLMLLVSGDHREEGGHVSHGQR